jgi:2-dehydropantoate 2-reductase
VTGRGKFTLGGASPRRAQVRELLSRVFPVRETDNLAGARWSKLAMNCAMSTLGAVSGFSLGQLAADVNVRSLALRVMAEVVDVAAARGVQLEPVSGLRPDKLVRWPAVLQHLAIWLAVRGRTRQRTGMIALLEQGRPAGVEDLNALIDRPLNQRLVKMVREIESGSR